MREQDKKYTGTLQIIFASIYKPEINPKKACSKMVV